MKRGTGNIGIAIGNLRRGTGNLGIGVNLFRNE